MNVWQLSGSRKSFRNVWVVGVFCQKFINENVRLPAVSRLARYRFITLKIGKPLV